MTEHVYVTTPIYYVNGAPHIGHAYTTIAADVYARWKRLDGAAVLFLTGTDEHGQKVEKAAQDAGVAPQAYVDRMSASFRDLEQRLGLSNDDFIRTTEERHKRASAAIWRRLTETGDIYPGHYEGWYAVRDEAFYDADELTAQPDGTRLAPTGAPVEWVREPNYLFRLSAWQDRLLAHYEANPDFIGPASRRNEVLSFVRGGLDDLSVSRTSFTWGIPVPGDPAHVMYVWLDALTNYLTAAGFPDGLGPFWPPTLQLVGKDILRFHTVYWPAFLMAAGLPLPKRVFAHGWWTVEGAKISKSVGNVIDPRDLVDRFGLDAVRYFLLREVPFGNDGDFSERALISRLNVELANELGNLCQRTLSFIHKNLGGVLPAAREPSDADAALLAAARALPAELRERIDRQAFHDALEAVWRVVRAANAYIDHQAPWALRKSDQARMGDVLRVLVETLRIVATVLIPFMPDSMGRMLDQLSAPVLQRSLAGLEQPMAEGVVLPPPQGIFPRYAAEA